MGKPVAATGFTLTGLRAGVHLVDLSVRCRNEVGWSDPSEAVAEVFTDGKDESMYPKWAWEAGRGERRGGGREGGGDGDGGTGGVLMITPASRPQCRQERCMCRIYRWPRFALHKYYTTYCACSAVIGIINQNHPCRCCARTKLYRTVL